MYIVTPGSHLQDPRETLIVTLRREVEALQNENDHLRNALDINKKSSAYTLSKLYCMFNIYIFRYLCQCVVYSLKEWNIKIVYIFTMAVIVDQPHFRKRSKTILDDNYIISFTRFILFRVQVYGYHFIIL